MYRLMAHSVAHQCSDGCQTPYRISAWCEDCDVHAISLGDVDVAQHAIDKSSISPSTFCDVEVSQINPQSGGIIHDSVAVLPPVAYQLLPSDHTAGWEKLLKIVLEVGVFRNHYWSYRLLSVDSSHILSAGAVHVCGLRATTLRLVACVCRPLSLFFFAFISIGCNLIMRLRRTALL